ncbi:radical SAM family heme chaperone HemW [Candidatus Synchoanobacter obligatus]|uniref:Heme chaperone HemW n=1 Tax=Candidatus Synchoanobacter obligatus TaxID=2919597 RepID=A0ABT1L4L9_9GAMM|nr:radical SAM family heme chaperone HemW [Candidatus Synchoanobacter obligatus]MCP8351813.1 radical SAM family heme chaperone HemW [Candidatus Synchoanobacter obligatus]
MIPLSLYIHLPWCVKKCPYCDFNAHPLKDNTDLEGYIKRLVEDLHSHQSILESRPIRSIFIGGGTPSLFSAQQLAPLFQAIQQYQDISKIEITIEANPGTQDCASYSGYVDLGINRISIGGQSFNPAMLTNLGRIHNGDLTHQAIIQAQNAGFKRINLDIMYGLPHQTLQEALDDLQQFIDYKLEHLSWYQLNIEANTLFAVKKPELPSDDMINDMDLAGSHLLIKNGYRQYEISAWTRNQPSFHNLNYWHFGDYLGIGCGAHSKITQTNPFKIERVIKHKHPKAYMNHLIQELKEVPKSDVILEYCIGQFRTLDPLDLDTFEKRTQLHRDHLIQALKSASEAGLLTITPSTISLTDKGFRHHNELCLSLVKQ